MTTIQTHCARCKCQIDYESPEPIDPDIWESLEKLLLCHKCSPPEITNSKPRRERANLPIADGRPMRTTTTCYGCGKEIPTALLGDAFCVKCRYAEPRRKPKAWDAPGPDGEPRPFAGSQIEKGGPNVEGLQLHNGKPMNEPTVDFDWGAIDGSDAEQARKDRERDNAIATEAVNRTVFWLNDGTITEAQAFRKVKIAAHYVDPKGSQADLARALDISPGRCSQLLNDFRSKLTGKQQI